MADTPSPFEHQVPAWTTTDTRTYADVHVIWGSGMIFALCVYLRLAAHSIAWPDSYAFGGSIEGTKWYATEMALRDISFAGMALSGLAFLVGLTFILRRASQR